MYLTAQELAEVRLNYRRLLASPEATPVKVVFSKYATGGVQNDEIYGNLKGTVDQEVVEICDVKSIIAYVTPRHLKLLEFDFIEVGDAIFYFGEDVNLSQPVPDVTIVDMSMYFVVPNDVEWTPDLERVGDLSRTLGYWLGTQRMGSAVPCKIRRT